MKQSTLLGISAIVLGLTLTVIQQGHGARILSLNFMSGKSHKITYDRLLQELAKRGHEVTVVTQVLSTSNATNPKEILTINYLDFLEKAPDMFDMKVKGEELNPFKMLYWFEDLCRTTYALPVMKEIMKQKFDLVLHEPFMNECAAGFLYKLNTSLVLITPFVAPSDIVRVLGGPAPPSFIPNFMSPFDNKMNFVERTKNFIAEIVSTAVKELYYVPKMEALYREMLNDSSIPGINEIIKNASLTLSNSHVSMAGARPYMPDIIEVGGMHMREAKPLPKDLEDFAQSSGEHGFIFFSMGSVLQGSKLPESHRKMLLSAFSKLKQKVLWKWETESMPDLPSNVKLIKWAPQQDILGHPKLRVFITHGGLGSTTEAIYHGVPLIGIPMFGDQNTNIEKFVKAEIAAQLDFVTMSEKDVLEAVETVISNPRYIKNIKGMSKIFRDQRDDPLERAVFWTEYVLRHQGAVHLRSPARDLNFFQYHSLDVISALLTAVFLIAYILYTMVKKLYKFCFGSRKSEYTYSSSSVSKPNGKKHN